MKSNKLISVLMGLALFSLFQNPVRAQNTLTGKLTVQQTVQLTGDITPTAISSNQNDYAPTGYATASIMYLSSDAARTLTGLAGGLEGRQVQLFYSGTGGLTLANQSSSSTAANRFALSSDYIVPAGGSVLLTYDSTATRWKIVGNQTVAAARTVATVAALKALYVGTLLPEYAVDVSGYYASGDGGGGRFIYTAGSSATDNGGTIIAPTTGSGRWLRVYTPGRIHARWFGAKGDNSTDDTTTIQNAIDFASADTSGVDEVYFSNGIYLCNVVLKDGVRLIGVGDQFPSMSAPFAGPILKQKVAGAVIDTPVGATYNIGVTGITVRGNGSGTAGAGIRFRNVISGTVKYCFFENLADQAIYQDGGVACEFIQVKAYNCLLNRAQPSITGVVHLGGTDHFIDRCELTSSATRENAISSSGFCNAIYIAGSNHFIANSIGEISDNGIVNASSLSRFINCRADLNFGHGYVVSSGSLFSNCHSIRNGRAATATYSGFYIDNAQGAQFTNCSNDSTSTATVSKYGFEDLTQWAAVESRNTYVNCRSAGDSIAPFYTEATNNINAGVQVPMLPVKLSTTGTITPDIHGTSLLILEQGSATTITNFTKGANSQPLYLIGNANVTIQNNSNIKTYTGSDLVLAADRVYSFVNFAGVWRQSFSLYSASDLATGTVPTARLGSGSASSSTFLRGDSTWVAPVTTATGTSNQVTVSASTGAVTFSLPQDIATTSTVRFGKIGLGLANANGLLQLASGTTNANGLYFGTDTALYRATTGSLTLSGSIFTIDSFSAGNNNAYLVLVNRASGSAQTAQVFANGAGNVAIVPYGGGNGGGAVVGAADIALDSGTGSTNASLTMTARNGGTGHTGSVFVDQNGGIRVRSEAAKTVYLDAGTTNVMTATTANITGVGVGFVTDTAGKTFSIKSGTNALAGTVTLTAGAGTISSTAIDANTTILLSLKTVGGTITGQPYVDTFTAGTGCTVTGGGAANTSTYNWVALKVN